MNECGELEELIEGFVQDKVSIKICYAVVNIASDKILLFVST